MNRRHGFSAAVALSVGLACTAPPPASQPQSKPATAVVPDEPLVDGPTGPGSPLSESERQALAAALVARIEGVRRAHPRGQVRSVCLTSSGASGDELLGQEPLAEVRDALQAAIALPVTLLGSACAPASATHGVTIDSYLVDRKTGMPAAHVSVSRPVQDPDGTVRFGGGLTLGGRWTHGFSCDLVLPDFDPEDHCRMTWIS